MGETVCPELPTFRSIGRSPASQIGREAASPAPSASANPCTAGILVLCAIRLQCYGKTSFSRRMGLAPIVTVEPCNPFTVPFKSSQSFE